MPSFLLKLNSYVLKCILVHYILIKIIPLIDQNKGREAKIRVILSNNRKEVKIRIILSPIVSNQTRKFFFPSSPFPALPSFKILPFSSFESNIGLRIKVKTLTIDLLHLPSATHLLTIKQVALYLCLPVIVSFPCFYLYYDHTKKKEKKKKEIKAHVS